MASPIPRPTSGVTSSRKPSLTLLAPNDLLFLKSNGVSSLSRPALIQELLATCGYLNVNDEIKKFSPSFPLTTFQAFNSYIMLVATVQDSTGLDHLASGA